VGKGERRWQEVFNSAIQARAGLDGRSAWAAPGCAELLSIASDRNKICHLLHLPTPPHPTHPPSLPSAPACCSASRRRTAACHSSQACCPYCRRASRCTTAVGGLVPSAFTQLASPGDALSRAREPRGAQHRRRLQGTERPQNNDLVLKSVSTSFFSTSFLPAGLLPILKELVEVLFQEQLVKVGDSVGWCLLVLAW
jgi:hypothetical protein